MKHKFQILFCFVFLVTLLSTLAIPVGAQQQTATATPPAPTQEGATVEMVTANPYGATLSLVLSDVFPGDVVSYYGDEAPNPSRALTTDEAQSYTLAQAEYIACAGGGFQFEDLAIPAILGTGSVAYFNLGEPVTFSMSANAGTWCTFGLVMGPVMDAASRVAGMYTRSLLAGGAPQVEAHVLVNTRDGEFHWAGTVDMAQTVLVEQTGQGGGGAVGVTDWENVVVIDPSGGPTTWPPRLDTTQFVTVQTTDECWVENDPNFSCTTRPQQPTSGTFTLLSGIGLRMSGDSIGIYDASCQTLLIERPTNSLTDWWFILNDSDEDLELCMIAPYGSDRQFFQLGNNAVWDQITVDLMYRVGMKQFLAPEQTVLAVTTPTPQPNCGSFTDGCDRSNVRGLVYTGEGQGSVLYYGVASEVEPFWTPYTPIPAVNWPVNG